jgi:predicted nucleic acid-binding protein
MNFLNKKILSLPKADLFISVISRMEVLAKPDHTAESEKEATDFLNKLTVVPLNDTIEHTAIQIRRIGAPRLRLPDAIVAATAVILNAKLVSADDRLLKLAWPGLTAVPPLLTI